MRWRRIAFRMRGAVLLAAVGLLRPSSGANVTVHEVRFAAPAAPPLRARSATLIDRFARALPQYPLDSPVADIQWSGKEKTVSSPLAYHYTRVTRCAPRAAGGGNSAGTTSTPARTRARVRGPRQPQ